MAKEVKKKTSSKNNATKKNVVAPTVSNTMKRKINIVDEDYTDAFIREVDEDVKNDNLRDFWNKYGLYVVLLVAVSLTLAVSFESIKAWKISRDQAVTNTYISTLNMKESGKLDESLAMFDKMSEEGRGIYQDIAKAQVVNILIKQGRKDEAVAHLKSMIEDNDLNETLRAVSRLKLVNLQFYDLTEDEFNEILNPIAEDKNWAPYVKEFKAMYAINNNNVEQAKALYTEIIELPELSEDVKSRIQDMLSVIDEK